MSIKTKEKTPPLEGVEGAKGGIGVVGIRAINPKRMDKSFIHLTWVEPNNYGDPIGPKGASGWDGDKLPDPLLLAIDYCKGIEEEYLKLTKRLRSFALTEDLNSDQNDDRICPIMRGALVNLYNDLCYLYENLKEIEKHGYSKNSVPEKTGQD